MTEPRKSIFRKVVITGANGLIARQMATTIDRYGAEVKLTSRSISLTGATHDYFSADLQKPAELIDWLERVKPDILIHTAGVTSVDYAALHLEECRQVNEQAVESIARWCDENGCRLVHFSTDFVFDGEKGTYSESDEPHPISIYGQSKWRSEQIVQRIVKNHLVIRTVLVYGHVPFSARLNFPLWVVTRLTEGAKTYITGDQFRAPTYVKDLAEASLELAFSDHRGLIHISGDEQLSIMDFARKTAQVFGLDAGLLEHIETAALNQPGKRPRATAFTNERVKSLIDYRPHSVEDGLHDLMRTAARD